MNFCFNLARGLCNKYFNNVAVVSVLRSFVSAGFINEKNESIKRGFIIL